MSRQQLSLPPIAALRSAPLDAQVAALDLLFEPSPAIHDALVPIIQSPTGHESYPALIDECHAQLKTLSLGLPSPPAASSSAPSSDDDSKHRQDTTLLAVLAAHPRLGAKKVDSAQSVAEQANLQGDEAQAEQLAALNAEYEARFPGLRYVVFVNGRGRPEIMRDMRARIDGGDYAKEVGAALQAMCDIAKDRAAKLSVQAA